MKTVLISLCSCSLSPPAYVREEWEKEYGLVDTTSDAFHESLEFIRKRINVTEGDSVVHNGQNQIMLKGCKRLG
tara:strand:+ start:102 stop:323 length:222 start_codon:yes stop_codon:yes gene_type:complete